MLCAYVAAFLLGLVLLGASLLGTDHDHASSHDGDPDASPAWPRQWVKVTMTLTSAFCPASGLILEQVSNRLAGIQEISKVEVDLVWEPQWTPHRISEAGRLQLGI